MKNDPALKARAQAVVQALPSKVRGVPISRWRGARCRTWKACWWSEAGGLQRVALP